MNGVFNLDKSAKAIIAAIVAGATALAAANDDSVITNTEKALAIGATLTALGAVWAFSNVYVKAALAAIIAAVASLGAGLNDDAMSAQEWITMGIAAVLAFGAVVGVKNSETPSNPPPN